MTHLASRYAIACAAALVASLAPTRAAAQPDLPALSAPRVAAQLGAGVALMPVGFVAGGKLTEWTVERLGIPDPRASRLALGGAWAGAALTTAAGPALVGARGPGGGRYLAAVGGAVVGGLGSALLVRLNDRTGDAPRPPCRLRCTVAAVAVFTLPSIGAAVGYDVSRR
jgi:hypothetical protein